MATTSSLQFRLRPKNTSPRSDSSISRKVIHSIQLWFLGLSSTTLLVLHYSSNPFSASPLLLADDSGAQAATTCDLGVGRWVRSPPEENRTCSAVLGSRKNCGKGEDRLNWRWKPEGCELKRFDAGLFLEMVRGKTMAFVGDSVARNQFESLLCLLSQVETPSRDQNKLGGDDRSGRWRFAAHNFTLTVLWSRFLVRAEQNTIDAGSSSSPSGMFHLHVDELDTAWTGQISSTDIVVVSAGRWFFHKSYLYEGGRLLGCTFCSEPNTTALAASFAVSKALRTALGFLSHYGVEATLLRTLSPAHLDNGGGGRCRRTPSEKESVRVYRDIRKAQVEEMERMRWANRERKKWFGCLDVTMAMMAAAASSDDCRHWCFPGPVDHWNELLLAVMETWR